MSNSKPNSQTAPDPMQELVEETERLGLYDNPKTAPWAELSPHAQAVRIGFNAGLDAAAKHLDEGAKYRLSETHDHAAEDWSAEIRAMKKTTK